MPDAIRVPSLRITELDGSPDVQGVERIYLTNGFVSNLGGGNVLVSLSGTPGDSTSTSTYATRPSASNDGNVFFPSDGVYLQRDTGAAYASWGPFFPFTEPVSADFSAVNFTGSTLTTTYGGMHIQSPSNGGAQGLRAYAKALPGGAYTITVAIMPVLQYTQFSQAAVGLRNSSNDDAVMFMFKNDSQTLSFAYEQWNSNTSGAVGSYIGTTGGYMMPWPLIWLRFQDDTTNRILSWSATGREGSFVQLNSIGRTDFVTPNQFFFGTNPFSQITGITLLSYKES